MKAYSEGRWKGEEKISRLSQSLPSPFQVDIGDSDSAEETLNPTSFCDSCSAKMVQRHSKLGAKPKWSAHADRSNLSGEESGISTIPPWRSQSLWVITTTETVEGLSDQPKKRSQAAI